MGGVVKGVGKIAGGLTGGLLGGDVSGESESTAQTVDNGLKAGDLVCLLPINGGQNYIVLGKLVYGAEATGATTSGGSSSSTLEAAASLIGGVT